MAILLAAVVLGAAATGCAADAGEGEEEIAEAEGELGAAPTAAGIKDGSPEEEGVLLLVNDRASTVDVLRARTKLTMSVARAIVRWRTTPDGEARWFESIDQLDQIAATGKLTFQRLAADAKLSGYTETPGLDAPTLAKIAVPSNLGRTPTSNDVVVEAGFDGKPTAEATRLVRSRIMNTVDASNERFVAKTIEDNHKAFTIAVGNLFAQASAHSRFARSLAAEKLTVLGTMSSVNPTILMAEKAGSKTYYARGASGGYEPIATPRYPVIMRARIRLATGAEGDPGQGVRVFYPQWAAKVLTGPTTVIIEGGQ